MLAGRAGAALDEVREVREVDTIVGAGVVAVLGLLLSEVGFAVLPKPEPD